MEFEIENRFEEITPQFKNADYRDVKTIETHIELREFIASMLSYYPWWLKLLYRIRTALVRIIGLGKQEIPDELFTLIPDEISFTRGENVLFFIVNSAEEGRFWIAETPDDKHLKAYFGIIVEPCKNNLKRFYIITTVHYKHWTGPVYFNLIRPFHHLVVSKMIRAGTKGNIEKRIST